ncbi:hypothetical protein NKI44_18925 [Mesorhizobium sp. M0614]
MMLADTGQQFLLHLAGWSLWALSQNTSISAAAAISIIARCVAAGVRINQINAAGLDHFGDVDVAANTQLVGDLVDHVSPRVADCFQTSLGDKGESGKVDLCHLSKANNCHPDRVPLAGAR